MQALRTVLGAVILVLATATTTNMIDEWLESGTSEAYERAEEKARLEELLERLVLGPRLSDEEMDELVRLRQREQQGAFDEAYEREECCCLPKARPFPL